MLELWELRRAALVVGFAHKRVCLYMLLLLLSVRARSNVLFFIVGRCRWRIVVNIYKCKRIVEEEKKHT